MNKQTKGKLNLAKQHKIVQEMYSLRHEPNETKVSITDESWWKVEKYSTHSF